MKLLIELLIILLEIPLIWLLFGCFLEPRSRNAWNVVTIVEILIAAGLSITRIVLGETLEFGYIYMLVNVITYILMIYLLSDILFTGNKTTKVLLTFLSIIFVLFTDFFTYMIAQFLFNVNYFVLDEGAIHYGGMVSSKFLEFAVLYWVNRHFKHSRSLPQENRLYLLQSAIPLLSAAFFVVYPAFNPLESGVDDTRYFLVIMIFALINIVHYVVFALHQEVANKQHENALLLQEYQYKEEYYQSVERYQKEIRAIKHDLKNQLITISAYIDATKQGMDDNPAHEDAGQQVRQLLSELTETGDMNYTAHSGINALLNAKSNLAREAGISCDFDITISEQMEFSARDMGSLLGNILDNAIEACRKCEGIRYLKLQMVYYNHSLIIRAENSSEGKADPKKTDKADKKSHGFGIPSIQNIVELYNGSISYEADANKFGLDILLWENPSG